MKATVGRIVHWYEKNTLYPLAAIVTGTYEGDDDKVDLDVHTRPTSPRHKASILSIKAALPKGDKRGGWTWPPRVEDTRTNMEKIHDVADAAGLRPVSDFVGDGTIEESKKGFGRE